MAGGVKLSNLAAIPFSQLDDEDIFYVVDVSNGTETYVSNRISLADLRRAIISGATAGIVAKPIVYELTDNAGTPVLPQGVTYASLLEDLTEKEAIVELNYLDKVFQVSLISNLRIEFSNVDPENIFVIRITNENVVSLESFDYSSIVEEAITGATTYTDEVAATKQNNLNISGTTAGLVFDDATSTLEVNKASVDEVLTDIRNDSNPAAPADNEIVTADNLRGALSVGQVVDVTCNPRNALYTQIKVGENDWQNVTVESLKNLDISVFLGSFSIKMTNTTNEQIRPYIGWSSSYPFQKKADGLKYLIICDVENTGSTVGSNIYLTGFGASIYDKVLVGYETLAVGTKVRLASVFGGDVGTCVFYPRLPANTTIQFEFSNWRQYEVTALTDEAIAYIAQLPDPDAFFRSTDAYSIRDKYLVKQDMVCPFIPTIEMSNSDLTVAAGLSYKMQYKSNTPITRTITADTIPTNGYGWDTHLQLFVDDNTTVNFQSPLILEDPLTPNAGHNMTIKWRNGQALVYVDDRDIGYIVNITAGTENGSLYYGLTNDIGNYITFANTIDGTPIEIDGITTTRSLNIIGNGSDKTIISGTTNTVIDGYYSSRYVNISDVNITCGVLYGYSIRNSIIHDINRTDFPSSTQGRAIEFVSIDNCSISNIPANSNGGILGRSGCSITNSEINNIKSSSSNMRGLFVYASGIGNSPFTMKGCFYQDSDPIFVYRGYSFNLEGSTVSNSYIIIEGHTSTVTTIKDSIINNTNINIQSYVDRGASTLIFSGTNINNSTISGKGSIILSVGSTLTSPEKSGIIDLSNNTHALSGTDITIDGMTVTNYSSTTNSVLTTNGTSNITNCSFVNNTISDTEGTFAITGSSAAVNVPNAVLNISDDSIVVISGNTFANNNNILFSGSNITATMSGTNIIKSKLTTYGLGADLTVSNNSIIDMTGNTNSTVINPGRSIVVGTGVKAVTTSGSTVNVSAGTYSTIKNDGTTTPLDANDLYGYYVDYKTNNDSITYVQLTDPSAEGLARFTTKTALEMQDVKEQYLDTRACLLYSNKIDMPEGKKNKVMFYLNNGDFTKKEDGTPLTADELLGKVTWNGSTRLCNFMKEYPELFIQIYQWGDEFILSQTGAAATTGQMFWRDTTQDTSSSYAWKYSTTTIWTASATPSINDLTYSDSSLSTVRSVTEGNLVVRYYGKQYYSVVFSKTEREGFIRDPWFWTSEDGVTHGKQYASLYMPVACDTNGNPIAHTTPADIRNKGNVSIGSGFLRSIPGETPLTATTLNNFRLYASRTGTDILNAMGRAYLNRMLVFDTGYFNTQAHIAQGLAYMQSFYYFEVRKTGRTMEYGNRTCQLLAQDSESTDPDYELLPYWQWRITAGRDASSTTAVTFTRTPANDNITGVTGGGIAYGWRYTTGGVNYDIWTSTYNPEVGATTYSDNTLTTPRSSELNVVTCTNASASKCVTFSWRGLEDFWGSCWEFEEGIQKRQDATLGYAESGYLFTNAISCYTNTEIFKMTDTVASLPIQVTASTLVKNSSNVYVYANTEVSISKSWNPLSGTGTGATQCWIEFPWPKASGGAGILDPITSFTIAANIQTNKVGDYFYNDAAAGSRVLIVGGLANFSSIDGAFSVHVNNALGNSYPYIACRLAASEF